MRNRSTTLPGKMTRAEADHGIGLTDTRRKVFELVIKAGQPVGAYRLLEAMQDKGTRVMPPTVYRALNFLQGKGLVHRIESLNAFIACTQHEHEHEGQFLICSDCGKTEELADESVSEMLREKASAHGFTLTQQTIELKGLCKECATE
jgi:Fur family transcriptional regulator, zinc uptake regulator